jgi:hypothetical protein
LHLSLSRHPGLFDGRLLRLNVDPLAFDIQTNAAKNAHVNVGNPHYREARNKIAPPVRVEQLEPGNEEKKRRDVMTETIFTSKEVKEFTFEEAPAGPALLRAPVPSFTGYFLVGYRPRYGSDRDRND